VKAERETVKRKLKSSKNCLTTEKITDKVIDPSGESRKGNSKKESKKFLKNCLTGKRLLIK